MALHNITASTSTQVSAQVAGDIWIIRPNVFVTVSGADAIEGNGTTPARTIFVYGGVVSDGYDGIGLGDNATNSGGSNRVYVAATGSIYGENNAVESHGGNLTLSNEGTMDAFYTVIIAMDGGNRITNLGALTSVDLDGVAAYGGDNFIDNAGSVRARGAGLNAQGDGNSLFNSGAITSETLSILINGGGNAFTNTGACVSTSVSASEAAIKITASTGTSNRIDNHGFVSGGLNGLLGGNGDDLVVNRGTIKGHVVLAAGNDSFDGRGGELDGEVRGGAGDDIYWLDDPDLILVENSAEGNDTVRAACTYELPQNFETLILIGKASIDGVGNGAANILTGNNSANVLNGLAGADTLRGRAGDDLLRGDEGSDVLIGGLGADTLNGGAGNDRAQYNDSTEGVVVDLQTPANNTSLAEGDVFISIENLFGSGYADQLWGDATANTLSGLAGDDQLQGRGGADLLVGGAGRDTLTGGAGADIFDFDKLSESAPLAANADTISDFTPGVDVIDVSDLDAVTAQAGDQAFTFLGTAALSGVAGELGYQVNAGDTYVMADVDGGGVDFVIRLVGAQTLSSSDLIL
jgi:Ca2+-binding RTX toxin-like protein